MLYPTKCIFYVLGPTQYSSSFVDVVCRHLPLHRAIGTSTCILNHAHVHTGCCECDLRVVSVCSDNGVTARLSHGDENQ
jgi:hypothetical protein